MPNPTYPVILTNKDWQKNKGLFAKGKKTGVGAALDTLQKAYLASPYMKASATSVMKEITAGSLDPQAFKKNLGTGVTKVFGNARKQIKTPADALEHRIAAAITMLGAGSAGGKHLAKMKVELDKFVDKTLPGYEHAFGLEVIEEYKARVQKTNTYVGFMHDKGAVTKKNVSSFGTALAGVTKIDDIGKAFGDTANANPPSRALTTACQNWDTVFAAEFPQFAARYFPAKAMTTVKSLPWISELGNEKGGGDATKKVEAMAARTSEDAAVAAFKRQAGASWRQAQKFLVQYFKFLVALDAEISKL